METNIVQNHSRGYSVTGQITHKESQLGIPNLTVLLFDQAQEVTTFPALPNSPVPPYLAAVLRVSNSLGSVVTDANGNFFFSYSQEEVHSITQGNRRLKLYIVVLGPEDENTEPFANLLYYSKSPRANAGKNEIFNVSISSATLGKKKVPLPKGRVQQFIAQKEEEEQYEKLILQYKLQKQAEKKEQNAAAISQLMESISPPPPTGLENHFLIKDGEPIEEAQKEAIKAGVERANQMLKIETGANARKKGVKASILLSPAQKAAIEATDPNNSNNIYQLSEAQLRDILQVEDTALPVDLVFQNPVEKYCLEKSAATKCALENLAALTSPGDNNPAELEDGEQALHPVKQGDILSNVQKMLVDMSSPESLLAPDKKELPRRPDAAVIQESVGAFSMKRGPAESPSFFDFHSLEIAFPHVWKQVFDKSLLAIVEKLPESQLIAGSLLQEHVHIPELQVGVFAEVVIETCKEAVLVEVVSLPGKRVLEYPVPARKNHW